MITRNGDTAVINYSDPAMGPGTNLEVGPELSRMTDLEVVDMHNDMLRNMQDHREAHPFVAIEIPEGSPQLEYDAVRREWSTRGDVLRCRIECSDHSASLPVIDIDGKGLSWREFGVLVSTYEGWGMRVMFVPDDEINKTPSIALQESKEDSLELSRLLKMKPAGSC